MMVPSHTKTFFQSSKPNCVFYSATDAYDLVIDLVPILTNLYYCLLTKLETYYIEAKILLLKNPLQG